MNDINTGHTNIKLLESGIILLEGIADYTYEVKDVIQNHEAIKQLSQGKKSLVLTISGLHSTATREAINYVSKGHHASFVRAEAFVIHSLSQRLLARFYLRFNKPVVPANYFTDRIKAEKWLRTFEN